MTVKGEMLIAIEEAGAEGATVNWITRKANLSYVNYKKLEDAMQKKGLIKIFGMTMVVRKNGQPKQMQLIENPVRGTNKQLRVKLTMQGREMLARYSVVAGELGVSAGL